MKIAGGGGLAGALMALLLLTACGKETPPERVSDPIPSDTVVRQEQRPAAAVGVWAVTDNATTLVLGRRLGGDTTSAKELVAAINRRYPRPDYPGVVLDSVGGRTAYVRVIDDTQLGQRMGSTGSAAYMAMVTYSLTSLAAVNSVHLSFKEGVHARPGRYTRADWHAYFDVAAE